MTVDQTKPYISIERGGKTHSIQLVMPDGSRADVVIKRTAANAEAIDYFYGKLKEGLNV
jgi:hypothetical protein